jgi:hypothetical protein
MQPRCEQREPWYSTPYSTSPIPQDWVEHWEGADGAPPPPTLHLPALNPFIPTEFAMVEVGGWVGGCSCGWVGGWVGVRVGGWVGVHVGVRVRVSVGVHVGGWVCVCACGWVMLVWARGRMQGLPLLSAGPTRMLPITLSLRRPSLFPAVPH